MGRCRVAQMAAFAAKDERGGPPTGAFSENCRHFMDLALGAAGVVP